MDADRGRLARAIQRRRDSLGFTQVQLADLAGVTDTTIRNLEGGREFKRLPASLPAVEQALGWVPGSARAILGGGEPTLAVAAAEAGAERYEIESEPDVAEDVGMIVRNTVIEVIGALAPDTPLSEVQEIEALALRAVLQRGRRPRQRHPQAFQDAEVAEPTAE